MTPDELRRMDNDLCIIFEKGLKPVKARKYYYFESQMVKKLQEYTLDHNDFDSGNRGVWRKFNPYNPYPDNGEQQDLKIDSLDDLFDDDKEEDKKDKIEKIDKKQDTIDDLFNDEIDAPTLPQEEAEDEFSEDIQKQLEAKFDELFGPLDDEN